MAGCVLRMPDQWWHGRPTHNEVSGGIFFLAAFFLYSLPLPESQKGHGVRMRAGSTTFLQREHRDGYSRYSLTTLVDKVLNVLKLEKTSMKFQTSSALKSDPENQVILCISYALSF